MSNTIWQETTAEAIMRRTRRMAPALPYERVLHIRIAWLFVLIVIGVSAVTLRLAYLQLWQHDRYANLALGQRFRGEVVEPERGRLLDRHLNPLAMSLYADAVYARPDLIVDAHETAQRLAPLIGVGAAALEERLTLTSPSVLLRAKLDPNQARAVRQAHLPGIILLPRPQRFYPHGELAGTVLGFAGIDNQGLEGLEYFYDDLLRGTPGRRLLERDPQGRTIPDGREEVVPPVAGHSLVLTIDQGLQYLVERELRAAVEATEARWGVAISVQPQTGEIVAMAQYPGFDPNTWGGDKPFRNRAITDQIEPGSTFKTIAGAIALELGVTRPDDLFDCPAELAIGGGRVRDWRYPQASGLLTFEEALANSCNTVFARLGGELIPPREFVRYLRAFGFGDRLGIDFPGEARGFIPTPGQVHGEVLRWANVAFGQGIAVTPLQLTMAVAALVNDGYLMRPYLVKEVRDAAGRTVERREPQALRQVVSPRTAAQMRRALEKVIEEGTGSQAAIPGYRILGKTGTAQIPEPGGYGEGRVASFIGAAPAEAPEVLTHVILYDVQSEVRYGGQLAAPLFAAITERILEQRAVPRTHLIRPDDPRGASGSTSPVVKPPRDPLPIPVAPGDKPGESGSPGDARSGEDETASPFRARSSLSGDWWSTGSEQSPAFDVSAGPVVVPDVRGQTIRMAIDGLEEVGLRIRIRGSGLAVSQDPEPGRTVPPQTVVEVHFESP